MSRSRVPRTRSISEVGMIRSEMADDLRFLGLDTTVPETVGFGVTFRPTTAVKLGMRSRFS